MWRTDPRLVATIADPKTTEDSDHSNGCEIHRVFPQRSATGPFVAPGCVSQIIGRSRKNVRPICKMMMGAE